MPVGARRNLSKSIIVHYQRKAKVTHSLGRYNDVLSHENFDAGYEARGGTGDDGEKVHDLSYLDDSYEIIP